MRMYVYFGHVGVAQIYEAECTSKSNGQVLVIYPGNQLKVIFNVCIFHDKNKLPYSYKNPHCSISSLGQLLKSHLYIWNLKFMNLFSNP